MGLKDLVVVDKDSASLVEDVVSAMLFLRGLRLRPPM